MTSLASDNRPGVLQLIDSLDAGGAERLAVEIANRLPPDRFRSFLVATRRGGLLEEAVAPRVERWPAERRGRFDLGAIHRLARRVREHRVAILHAHSTSLFLATAVAALAGKSWTDPAGRRRTPVVVWHDHFGAAEVVGRPFRIYGLAARRAGAVLAVSENLARWAREALGVAPERVTYLPHFPPIEPGEPGGGGTRATSPLPPEMAAAPREARILCVANLRPQKDHDTLLTAFSQLLRNRPEATLFLAGGAPDPELTRALEERATALGLGSRVVFLGSRPDVPRLLGAAAVGVLSSRSEGLPLALLEYGAAGLPAVATAVGQCPEVLDGGRAGLLVPPGDPAALAGALERLLADRPMARELAERLRQRVAALYDPGVAMNRIATLYDRLLAPEPSPRPGETP